MKKLLIILSVVAVVLCGSYAVVGFQPEVNIAGNVDPGGGGRT